MACSRASREAGHVGIVACEPSSDTARARGLHAPERRAEAWAAIAPAWRRLPPRQPFHVRRGGRASRLAVVDEPSAGGPARVGRPGVRAGHGAPRPRHPHRRLRGGSRMVDGLGHVPPAGRRGRADDGPARAAHARHLGMAAGLGTGLDACRHLDTPRRGVDSGRACPHPGAPRCRARRDRPRSRGAPDRGRTASRQAGQGAPAGLLAAVRAADRGALPRTSPEPSPTASGPTRPSTRCRSPRRSADPCSSRVSPPSPGPSRPVPDRPGRTGASPGVNAGTRWDLPGSTDDDPEADRPAAGAHRDP